MILKLPPKKELRILGIDDGPFDKFKDKDVIVVGTIFRGGSYLDGLLSTKVRIDGKNSTRNIAKMILNSRFKSQIQLIFLDGIAVGGFNVIDANELHKLTKIPIIIVMRNYPDHKKMFDAMKKIGMGSKIPLITDLPKPVKVDDIFIQCIGVSLDYARLILKLTCTHSMIPEPLRQAHIIASGIVKKESYGDA